MKENTSLAFVSLTAKTIKTDLLIQNNPISYCLVPKQTKESLSPLVNEHRLKIILTFR